MVLFCNGRCKASGSSFDGSWKISFETYLDALARYNKVTKKLLPPGLNMIPTKLVKINHSLNKINAKKKKHPKFGVLIIKSPRKVIHVRSFLNLLPEA